MSMITTYKIKYTEMNAFTEEHLNALNKLIVPQARPEMYDNENFKTVEFVGFRIINADQLTTDLGGSLTTYDIYGKTQQARLFGGVDDEEEKSLDRSFKNNDVKLNLDPMSVYTADDNTFSIISGHRRNGRFEKYNFVNRIVAVYRRKSGVTEEQVMDELSQLGNIFNPSNPPSVPAKEYDIVAEGIRAVQRGWISRELSQIQNRLAPQCKSVGIGDIKLSQMAVDVLNATATAGSPIVLPMGEERAQEWLANSKFKDIPGKIKYKTISYSTWGKSFSTMQLEAAKNPNVEYRIIVHPGVLTNLSVEQYDDRIAKFYNGWYSILNAISVNNNGIKLTFGNIVLYGAIPVLSEFHDLTDLCYFAKDSEGETYQKRAVEAA